MRATNQVERARDFGELSFSILRLANRVAPFDKLLRQTLELVADFSGADKAELRFDDGHWYCLAELCYSLENPFVLSVRPRSGGTHSTADSTEDSGLEGLCAVLSSSEQATERAIFASRASFFCEDVNRPFRLHADSPECYSISSPFPSLAAFRFELHGNNRGLLLLWGHEMSCLKEAEFYESVAQTIGVALRNFRAQEALRERVKELTCLYNIDRLLEQSPSDLNAALDRIVSLLPLAWLHSEIAQARIILDGSEHTTAAYQESPHRQRAEIVLGDEQRGSVEVIYTEPRPTLDEGPFLDEERRLLEMIANRLALVLQNKRAEQEHSQLEAQLRHADRLATIGQLAAGVAHELNEPLANVLGFAQLAQKDKTLPPHLARDIARVVEAALHAREVVSKLMLFARQKPPARGRVNLNQLVEGGLYFLSARCAKANIELVRDLDPALPEIDADAGQVHQVLVNLAVNAMQAMPTGGRLTIRTTQTGEFVMLSVEDTGIGMSSEVLSQIFTPFFTTKGVGEGTGLGLPVVHGIVTGHGGSMEVWSEVGCGSRFAVTLPVRKPKEPHRKENNDT